MTSLSSSRTYKRAKPDRPRLIALSVLEDVNRSGAYSNLILPRALEDAQLDERDRSFITELVYGTIRMQGLYDYIFSLISSRPWVSVDDEVQDIARLGAHQILSMRIPDHAAVSATVDLARHRLGEPQGAFINALLRKLVSQSLADWLKQLENEQDVVRRLAIKHSHPEWIVSAYLDLLKNVELCEAELISNNRPARPTLVAWPGDSTQSDLVDLGAEPVAYSEYGARFDGAPTSLPIITSRRAGVQDEGSQLVASIFYDVAKEVTSLLDICAGPGGKSALLSRFAFEHGQEFFANEISEARAELVEQVIKTGSVRVGDARAISETGRTFDAILADVPCTGIGALRRRPEVRWRRTLKDLSGLLELQREIIDASIEVLNAGGYLGYATCSPHFAETSGQVAYILKKYPTLQLVDLAPFLPEGLSDAIRDGALSLWGHRHNTDAMFLAVFRKVE